MTGNACSTSRVPGVDDNPTVTRLLHTYLTAEGDDGEGMDDGLQVDEAVEAKSPFTLGHSGGFS